MDCPLCGAPNEADAGTCIACGAPLSRGRAAAGGAGAAPRVADPTSRRCPGCSTLNAATFRFCARCGRPLRPAEPQPASGPLPVHATIPPHLREPPRAVARAGARARISAIARDGSRSAGFVLARDETRIGSRVPADEVRLDRDPFVAPEHATLRFVGGRLVIEDAGTPNGVFLWVRESELQPGDELRLGRQRLRIEWSPEEPEAVADEPLWGSPDPGYPARAVQLLEGGGEGDVYPLHPGENLVGRVAGDVSFPQDGYVSSRHAILDVGAGRLAVRDLGSANGTYHRLSAPTPVGPGDLLLVGEQILRVDPA